MEIIGLNSEMRWNSEMGQNSEQELEISGNTGLRVSTVRLLVKAVTFWHQQSLVFDNNPS